MLKKNSALGGWRMRTFQIKEDGTLVWFKVRSLYTSCFSLSSIFRCFALRAQLRSTQVVRQPVDVSARSCYRFNTKQTV